MAKVFGAIVLDVEKCKGCELCVGACPTHVIRMAAEVNSKGYNYACVEKPEDCTGCGNCGIICPDAVITVYRKKIEKVN